MLREFRADLHIHTCLSPCADLDLSPRAIIAHSKEKKIDILGITDHHSADHVLVVRTLGSEAGIAVIGGIEVTTKEEIHLLVFFENPEEALIFQGYIYSHLPAEENNEEAFGFQPVVNRDDEILFFNKRLLIGATDIALDQVIQRAHEVKGIVIASHIDREAFSIISQLGTIPDHVALDALEISPLMSAQEAQRKFLNAENFPMITASDAHSLQEIGRKTTRFLLEAPNFEELKMALRGEGGRKVIL